MTKRKLEKIKRRVLAERDRAELEAWQNMKIPFLWRILYRLGLHKFRDTWIERWAAKRNAALRVAIKNTLRASVADQVKKEVVRFLGQGGL